MAVELGSRLAPSRRRGDGLLYRTTQRLRTSRQGKERQYSSWFLTALLLFIFLILCVNTRELKHLTLAASSTNSVINVKSKTNSGSSGNADVKPAMRSEPDAPKPNQRPVGPRIIPAVRTPAPIAKSTTVLPPVSGLEEPAPGLFVPGAPLDAVNPSGKNFDFSDENNPTKIPRPPTGFPPRQLPAGHRLFYLLRQLRKKTVLHPRWPDHPELHLQKLKSFGPGFASIVFSDKLKVVYAPVFKVGTTSMMWNIAYLENIKDVVTANMSDPAMRDWLLHDVSLPFWRDRVLCSTSSIDRIRSVLNNPEYLKFGFVRNPYHRIVSAYLDKVVKWDVESEEYQTQMYGLYGDDQVVRKLRNETKPTFKEFLAGVERVISTPRTKSFDLRTAAAYEDNTSRREIHWRPQVELLHPDLIHFDFIGKFGRMDEDKKHVLKWMYKHTDRRLPEGRRRMHSTDPKDKVALFKELREDQEIKNLVMKAYKEDFQRFGFSTNIPPFNEHM